MVLRILVGLVLLASCKQSLFDSHGDVDARGDGTGDVASSCPATCLADAAADFGMTKWKYFDDNKNRSWTAMTMMDAGYNGTGSNRFWERSWAVMAALSAEVVTSAPLEWSP